MPTITLTPNKNADISINAQHYVLTELARRIGVDVITTDSTVFPSYLSCYYGLLERESENKPQIIIVPCKRTDWEELIRRPGNSLPWLPAARVFPPGYEGPIFDSVPVLLWGDGYENGDFPFAEQLPDGTIVFYVDILSASLFMLTRWEETISSKLDQHERFPSTESLGYRQKFLDRPVADEYALILQAWLSVLLSDWEPSLPKFTIRLSHDIDHIRTPWLRNIGGDLIKHRSFSRSVKNFKKYRESGIDPYLLNCYELARLSEQSDLKSSFYFMSADPGSHDSGYALESMSVQRCIYQLQQRGHEIGFHPGYETYLAPDCFYEQKERFEVATRLQNYGGRQHYLRFSVPETWRLWEEAGLSYDSTVGYAEHEGFRCGTCHPYQPFDLIEDRPLKIVEIPLIVMDVTLQQYKNLQPRQAEAIIMSLAERCRVVNGTFTLLWHNTSFGGEWSAWEKLYGSILPRLRNLL